MQSVNSICNWTSTRPRSPLCWKSLSQRTGHYHIWTNVSQPPITADCGGHLTTACRWAWCWRACSRGGVRGVTAVAMLPMSGRYPAARPGQHITNTTLHNTLLKQSYVRLQLLWTLKWPCMHELIGGIILFIIITGQYWGWSCWAPPSLTMSTDAGWSGRPQSGMAVQPWSADSAEPRTEPSSRGVGNQLSIVSL